MAPPGRLEAGSGLFGDLTDDAVVFDPPRATIPAGFDAVAQLSRSLLSRLLAEHLAAAGLNPLGARVPYGSVALPPAFAALVAPHVGPFDMNTFLGPQIEVQLAGPVVASFDWPAPRPVIGRARARDDAPGRGERRIELHWSIAVNLFRPDPGAVMSVARVGPDASAVLADMALVASDGQERPPPQPAGTRLTLGRSVLSMIVPCRLLAFADQYRFSLVGDFDRSTSSPTADDPTIAEFLQSAPGKALLGDALAPLRSRTGVAIGPNFAIAGGLTAAQIAAAGLAPLRVDDLVVAGDAGGEALTFCVSVGGHDHGAPELVRSFLAGRQFAYYVSQDLITPMFKGVWRAHAMPAPVVGDMPIEMQIDPDSDETGTGRVRVSAILSDTLEDARIAASLTTRGDPLEIHANQTVSVLAMWDPNGRQIEDLGDLATPTVEPFSLSVQPFNPPTTFDHLIGPPAAPLIAAMLNTLYLPVLERYPITAVGGFASCAIGAMVVRWNLIRAATPATDAAADHGGLLVG